MATTHDNPIKTKRRRSKKVPEWNRQMAKLIALSYLTGYSVTDLQEMAFDTFLEVEAPILADRFRQGTKARTWEQITKGISDSDIAQWTPLWAILQDNYDQAVAGGRMPEPGEAGSTCAALKCIAKDADVSIGYTVHAALYHFLEHASEFIHNPDKFRVPTDEEETLLYLSSPDEMPNLEELPGWESLGGEKQEWLRGKTQELIDLKKLERQQRGILLNSSERLQ